jgi:hypothetical protein
MTSHPDTRRLRTARRLGLALTVALALTPALDTAGAAVPGGEPVYYTRQTTFLIPFHSDPADRRIQQVLLHVSQDLGKTYQQVAAAGPGEKGFRFQAPRDGWYWFVVQAQDIDGRFFPANLQQVQPGLRVLVDNQPPVINLRAVPPREGGAAVEWEVTDAAPDPQSVRLSYRPQGGNWLPLEAPAVLVGAWSWTPQGQGPIDVKLEARDRAGNRAEQVIPLTPLANRAAAAPPEAPRGNVILVNRKQIRLNFKIDDVGKSDVAKIEVWVTRDNGKTWELYPKDVPKQPPIVIEVAEEGRYGFTLVATSGVGLSEGQPRAGDPPQVWVEVDETPPEVQLVGAPEVGRGQDKGKLTIRWRASDKHLGPTPITLSWGAAQNGPWTPIAAGLPNDQGRYVWNMPAEGLPFKFFVRIEAVDLAGNVGSAVTPEEVKVDLNVPRARVIGVEPAPGMK